MREERARVMRDDEHLTYVAAGPDVYDVYPVGGGMQLGWVAKDGPGWRARSDDPAVDDEPARTRWEAAVAMWGGNR